MLEKYTIEVKSVQERRDMSIGNKMRQPPERKNWTKLTRIQSTRRVKKSLKRNMKAPHGEMVEIPKILTTR